MLYVKEKDTANSFGQTGGEMESVRVKAHTASRKRESLISFERGAIQREMPRIAASAVDDPIFSLRFHL